MQIAIVARSPYEDDMTLTEFFRSAPPRIPKDAPLSEAARKRIERFINSSRILRIIGWAMTAFLFVLFVALKPDWSGFIAAVVVMPPFFALPFELWASLSRRRYRAWLYTGRYLEGRIVDMEPTMMGAGRFRSEPAQKLQIDYELSETDRWTCSVLVADTVLANTPTKVGQTLPLVLHPTKERMVLCVHAAVLRVVLPHVIVRKR